MNPFMFCDCSFFAEYVKNLTFQLLCGENETLTWITLKKYMEHYSKILAVRYAKCTIRPCSLKFCTTLLNNMEIFRDIDNMSVSTLLITVISAIYLRDANRDFCSCVRNVSNLRRYSRQIETVQVLAALRGQTDFMELLVNFGLVSSLPNESSFLYKETHRKIRDFM